MEQIIDAYGWLGALLLLAAYVLHGLDFLKPGPAYHLLNLIGASGILVCSLVKQTYQPAFLNAVWMAVAAIALCKPRRDPFQGVGPTTLSEPKA